MNPKWRDYVVGFALLVLAAALILGARACRAGTPPLSYAQKQAMVSAWRAGYHVGLPDAFAAVVYVESSACQSGTGDYGLAFGCSQVHQDAAYAATGVRIPTWILADRNLQDLNMAIGARYLELCMRRWGWPAGIGCYNVSPRLARKLGRKGLARLGYTRKVLAAMHWLKQLPVSED